MLSGRNDVSFLSHGKVDHLSGVLVPALEDGLGEESMKQGVTEKGRLAQGAASVRDVLYCVCLTLFSLSFLRQQLLTSEVWKNGASLPFAALEHYITINIPPVKVHHYTAIAL